MIKKEEVSSFQYINKIFIIYLDKIQILHFMFSIQFMC